MACNMTINFTSAAAALIANIKSKIEGQDGTFTGDESAGSFAISLMGNKASGSYTIEGQQIAITIDNKPFFVSCSQIQKFLESSL